MVTSTLIFLLLLLNIIIDYMVYFNPLFPLYPADCLLFPLLFGSFLYL